MHNYQHLKDYSLSSPTVVTLGTFDGVHLGHQALVERAMAKAREICGTAVLLTLEPHPRRLIDPGFELARLTLPAERAELLASLGLDALVEQAFTADFAQTSSLDFVRRDLVGHLGMKHLIVGYDHRFGRNREGDFAQLQEFAGVFDFGLDRVDAVMGDRDALSSTKIRAAVAEGRVRDAARALGRPHFLRGEVVAGRGIGRNLGYRTANVGGIHPDKAMPAHGVYAVRLDFCDAEGPSNLAGVANYGLRPSFGATTEAVLEVHLLDFEVQGYGRSVEVRFIDFIRAEQTFETPEALKAQIARDVVQAREALALAL
ncbi:MAG: bifunctional riboflavin kinase/FAD synthetase [Cryomorphaceae bacterium]|nr:bifunctional riboflavin kinase/FAD synthetase [Cryomorphaceae bacterium]